MSQNENQQILNVSLAGTVSLGEAVISRMAFGTMQLPGPGVWGEPRNPHEARRVLRRAVELGINYLDTASFYGPLVSDRLIVEALYPYPAGLVIGTKVGGWRGSDKSWIAETRPEQLKNSVEDNLDRLRLERLPLVHLRYAAQAGVPFEDSLGAMIELSQAGKIQHIGLSAVTLDQLVAARRLVPIVSVQNLYNLVDRRDEAILEYCSQQDIPFMPFFPL
ncbi:MAG TPA: aldo/keto reductase, partial [Ktedonobacteraceae bacterium]|nr:aldo/keto reductase [Ktedonobacteraceae bacterium]